MEVMIGYVILKIQKISWWQLASFGQVFRERLFFFFQEQQQLSQVSRNAKYLNQSMDENIENKENKGKAIDFLNEQKAKGITHHVWKLIKYHKTSNQVM